MLTQLLDYVITGQEPASLSRRELLRDMPRDLAVLGGLGFLLQNSESHAATPVKTLGNYPVMGMDGRFHDYYKQNAPVLDVPSAEIHKYPAGILNYLKGEGNPRAGKPAVLAFGAHWCSPCGANMPFLEQLYQNLTYRDVQVVGINLFDPETEPFEETLQKTKEKIKEKKITYPNLIASANSIGAMVEDHVPEGARFPQILLVNMPSAEVKFVTQYLFELGERGLHPSADLRKLYRQIDRLK